MKKLTKCSFLSIKKTFNKFLSILLIILLGVGFFAGIKATSPDMRLTADTYYKENNMYDISLLSTWGITEDEINKIKEMGYQIEGSYSIDAIAKNEVADAVKVYSYNPESTINKIVLVEGRLPISNKECVIEKQEKYQIGDTVIIETNDLKEKELTIAGFVKSPLYISRERGTTKLLSGKISFYLYTLIDNFKLEVFTESYIDINDDLNTFESPYEKMVSKKISVLEKEFKLIQQERYENEINKAQKELNSQIKKVEIEKQKALNKINKAKKEIKQSEQTFTNNGLNINLSNKEIKTYINDYQDKQTIIDENITNLVNSKNILENLIANNIDIMNNTYQLDIVNTNLTSLYDNSNSIKQALAAYNGLLELNKAKEELNQNQKIINKKFKEAFEKLQTVQEEINNIESPKSYVLGLNANLSYNQYKQDAERIANVAKVFPLVFYIVAVLICLTTMTRMVEEERGDIGLLKSLGYTNMSIMKKYLIYGSLATLIGSVLGVFIGFALIPKLIFNMYAMMYNLEVFVSSFQFDYALTGTLIALGCILLATLNATIKVLKESPANLLRPKAPKPGKRVFLEKINFIWKRLSFSKKVAVRNVFRYKKRFLMTIIGIAGCTGLIITGFGVKDCITNMVPNQFGKIYNYDIEVTFDNDKSSKKKEEDIEAIKNMLGIKTTIVAYKEAIYLNNYDTNQTIQLIVPFGDLSDFIRLQNRKSKESYHLNNKVLITEKIASLLNINVDDTLEISGENEYKVQVGGITENYFSHFIYMSKEIYNDDLFNTLYIITDELTANEEELLATKIKDLNTVSSISLNSSIEGIFDRTMNSFKSVTLILIISAGLLAFVVLYNLASVNISERKRELASIKVLGFYDFEVYKYVSRENILLTVIGILLGILMGNVLTEYVMKTCELDITMFDSVISFSSYIYSIILTLLFTFVVDIVTYFVLKKIKMVESLKSVE